MMATVNDPLTQQIILYLLEQCFLRYHELSMKTNKSKISGIFIMSVKSNEYVFKT